jgi:membrane protein YqaA with SNARE-associated domain
VGAAVIWHQLLVGLTAAGFGLLSAVVPLANAEAYVLAARASSWGTESVVGITIGQSAGKLILFLAARRGRQLPIWHRRPRVEGPVKPPGRMRRLSARLLALLGTKRWGLPVVLLAAVVGLPPIYAVAILAGTTSMKAGWFLATVTVGRLARFSLLALGMGEVLLHLR